jgi:pantoate--beta-alanine ligase
VQKLHFADLNRARDFIKDLERQNASRGTIHTLGALHQGHGELIKRASRENDITIVTVYPNKIQLRPGANYPFNLQEDVEFAHAHGADVVISSTDDEMFPSDFRTFIDQGLSFKRLNSSIHEYAGRGQVTGCIRWINFTKATRSYFGMKDATQTIGVRRAVRDLFIDCEVVPVPCVRYRSGMPLSSRLAKIDAERAAELASCYHILDKARISIRDGERDIGIIRRQIADDLSRCLNLFSIKYLALVDDIDFEPKAQATLPLLIELCVSDGQILMFESMYLENDKILVEGPESIWI